MTVRQEFLGISNRSSMRKSKTVRADVIRGKELVWLLLRTAQSAEVDSFKTQVGKNPPFLNRYRLIRPNRRKSRKPTIMNTHFVILWDPRDEQKQNTSEFLRYPQAPTFWVKGVSLLADATHTYPLPRAFIEERSQSKGKLQRRDCMIAMLN